MKRTILGALLLMAVCAFIIPVKASAYTDENGTTRYVSIGEEVDSLDAVLSKDGKWEYGELGGNKIVVGRNWINDKDSVDQVIIPSKIDGKKVVGIGLTKEQFPGGGGMGGFFWNKKTNKSVKVKKVVIPDSVTEIYSQSLICLDGTETVVIGKNVKAIRRSAFYMDSTIKNITIKSAKLKTVESFAIGEISKNAVIKVPKSKKSAYKKLFTSETGFLKSMKIK